jgi:hypothetical protein
MVGRSAFLMSRAVHGTKFGVLSVLMPTKCGDAVFPNTDARTRSA